MSGKRDSNIELLRIITMILIVGHHYVFHGLYNSMITGGCNQSVVKWWGYWQSNSFFAISGWKSRKLYIFYAFRILFN